MCKKTEKNILLKKFSFLEVCQPKKWPKLGENGYFS